MKQGLKEFGRILLAIIVIVWAIGIVVKIGNKVYKSVKKNNITQQKFDTKSFKDSKNESLVNIFSEKLANSCTGPIDVLTLFLCLFHNPFHFYSRIFQQKLTTTPSES